MKEEPSGEFPANRLGIRNAVYGMLDAAGWSGGPHRARGANSIEMRDRENGMRGRPPPHLRIDKSTEGKRGARPVDHFF